MPRVLLPQGENDMRTSINIADGLCQLKVAIQEYNTRVESSKHIHSEFIVGLDDFVLTNNYFLFGHNTHWLQISGTTHKFGHKYNYSSLQIHHLPYIANSVYGN